MELILWRHAQTEPGEPDEARHLTRKGRNDAEKMGKWLDGNLPGNCLILASTALRAVQTADALGRKFRTHSDLAPGSTPEKILAAAGWPDGKNPVLVVGHQPALGRIASMLMAGASQDWRIKRSSVWWIAQRTSGDASSAYLRAVVPPDLLGKK